MDEIKDKLTNPSKETMQDKRGHFWCYLSLTLIILLVASILYFITSKGIATFVQDKVNIGDFLTGKDWDPAAGAKKVGALPMITTSFAVTVLSALTATPFALAIGLFTTQYAKNGAKFLQPVIELFGRNSVRCLRLCRFDGHRALYSQSFRRNRFWDPSGTIVLFVMVLPTITSLTIDSLKAVPLHYRQASLALGATRWQTIYKVILRASAPGIFTAVIFGMARAFGEALAVQMVIGNACLMPKSLVTPTATLTSQLTSQMGNTVMGTLSNNALWSLALILLFMSLFFNLLVRLIAKRGEMKK